MARTEDGEFELVLGNKQLLSVFFIIVVLIGVFFAMGYIWGRNSTTVATASERPAAPASARSDGPSAMGTKVGAAAPAEQQPAGDTGTANSAAAPAGNAPGGEASKPADTAAESAAAVSGSRLITPEKGQSFVQVMSMLAMPEAESLADVLAKKNLPAVIAPGPSEGKFRVMVGPVKDTAQAGKYKTELEGMGFKGTFLKKYE